MEVSAVISKKLLFKKAMVWEKDISDFVRSRMLGYTLNIPCGDSEIGDVRIDVQERPTSTKQGDMREIPYPNETFDTVISDPPWKLDYYNRWKPFLECVRVTKVGGRIIYNATWIPASKQVDLEELWIRQSSSFANVSVLSVFKRTKNTND
jgi:hypothetical protein